MVTVKIRRKIFFYSYSGPLAQEQLFQNSVLLLGETEMFNLSSPFFLMKLGTSLHLSEPTESDRRSNR